MIDLEAGDRVVASFPFRDIVLVITARGSVYQIGLSQDSFDDVVKVTERDLGLRATRR